MESPVNVDPVTSKRGRRTTIILAIAGLSLCCACLALAIAGYGWNAAQGGLPQDQPVEDVTPSGPQNSLTPSLDPNSIVATPGTDLDPGEAPTGGLGNDILRNDTWRAVAAAAAGQGCDQPVGADSTIEVVHQPDSAGVWVEQWTVACQSGDTYDFEVEFVPDATGATFNIRALP